MNETVWYSTWQGGACTTSEDCYMPVSMCSMEYGQMVGVCQVYLLNWFILGLVVLLLFSLGNIKKKSLSMKISLPLLPSSYS